jgi:hypothetical protein
VVVFVLDEFGNGSFYLPYLWMPMLVQVVETEGLVALDPYK